MSIKDMSQYILVMVKLFMVDGMAHPLSAFYGIPHGVACATLLPYVMEFNKDYTGEKFREIARVMGVEGGSWGDSGTTGRKIVCDTYGGRGRIGGGCFSSKDPTKVDRSAAYYSRYVAKNIVANGLARRCEVEVAYAIGKAQPVSLCVDTFGTGKFDDEKLLEIVKKNFNFEVGNIISELDLRKPVYHKTSCYGHFGDPQFTWEKVKKLEY